MRQNSARRADLDRLGPQEFISFYSYSAKGEFVHAGASARKRRPEASLRGSYLSLKAWP